MAIKSYRLIKLEELGIFRQDRKTGKWYINVHEEYDITEELYKAGMFEH